MCRFKRLSNVRFYYRKSNFLLSLSGVVAGNSTYKGQVAADIARYEEVLEPIHSLPPAPPSKPRGHGGGGGGGGRGGGGGGRKKKIHVQQARQHQLNRSWEDLNRLKRGEPMDEDSIRTTPSLPVVLDSKIIMGSGPGQPGYFDLYRSKMKLIREKKW